MEENIRKKVSVVVSNCVPRLQGQRVSWNCNKLCDYSHRPWENQREGGKFLKKKKKRNSYWSPKGLRRKENNNTRILEKKKTRMNLPWIEDLLFSWWSWQYSSFKLYIKYIEDAKSAASRLHSPKLKDGFFTHSMVCAELYSWSNTCTKQSVNQSITSKAKLACDTNGCRLA